ncbi:MAG: hypothetical protein HYY09_07230, partial [Firmicutes bacterium]|nr:hypothetical protein [Bacillota bacterium]
SGRDEKWIKDQVRGEIGHLRRKIASGKVDTVPVLRQVEGTRPLGSMGPEKD